MQPFEDKHAKSHQLYELLQLDDFDTPQYLHVHQLLAAVPDVFSFRCFAFSLPLHSTRHAFGLRSFTLPVKANLEKASEVCCHALSHTFKLSYQDLFCVCN